MARLFGQRSSPLQLLDCALMLGELHQRLRERCPGGDLLSNVAELLG
jgi:hypothetical protein